MIVIIVPSERYKFKDGVLKERSILYRCVHRKTGRITYVPMLELTLADAPTGE